MFRRSNFGIACNGISVNLRNFSTSRSTLAPRSTTGFSKMLSATPSCLPSGTVNMMLRRSGVNQSALVSLCVSNGQLRNFSVTSRNLCDKGQNKKDQLAGYHEIDQHRAEEEQKEEEQAGPGHSGEGFGSLPFPAPFHTINIVMLLFIANVILYLCMNFGNDDMRDFIVEHFTLSHENYHKIYPFLTSSLYQEQILQLAIDCWLLFQFGNTMMSFLGNTRMTVFWMMTSIGGGLLHVGRQQFQLYYGMDPLECRGRCFGPNPFILGLVGVEGLIFRHLNFLQNPPVPFLVLTAFVMVIDIWRIFTTTPEEHGAPTGGALVAYLFWALPTRCFGLDKLTAAM